MKVIIEFDEKHGRFQMSSDGSNFETIAVLEIAKDALIKKGSKEGMSAIVRRVDIPR